MIKMALALLLVQMLYLQSQNKVFQMGLKELISVLQVKISVLQVQISVLKEKGVKKQMYPMAKTITHWRISTRPKKPSSGLVNTWVATQLRPNYTRCWLTQVLVHGVKWKSLLLLGVFRLMASQRILVSALNRTTRFV